MTGAPDAPGPLTAVGEVLGAASAALSALPETSPRLEAELLLAEATGWSRTSLIAWPERRVEPPALAAFRDLLARRLAGEPIAYIRGRQAFWTLELRVTRDTLIPRPETELLVEIALALPESGQPRRVADLGTGSGAIAAALASERPGWSVFAIERSAAALSIARSNFSRLGLANCLPLRADWLAPIGTGMLDLILANPPYIPADDAHLSRGDPRFEPRQALAAGADGLDAFRAIGVQARRCLAPGGLIAIEHGFDQGPAARKILRDLGLDRCETRRDLAGHERATLGWV
jgi:release factor glutamine methyltransferase